jgi:hypothetical protein
MEVVDLLGRLADVQAEVRVGDPQCTQKSPSVGLSWRQDGQSTQVSLYAGHRVEAADTWRNRRQLSMTAGESTGLRQSRALRGAAAPQRERVRKPDEFDTDPAHPEAREG